MDGVPGLTQPPIRPGESFVYEFTPPVPARSGTTPMPTACMAFVADNPGDWMLHCHVTDHQVSGLMTVLRVA
jgi:FtsP/CotA-like multicopper oxidase with cupredoxin domain